MCCLNQHIAQRKNECKGGGASVQENEVKYLLCMQMQETHLIHNFRWLNWPCGEPRQHLHSLSALGSHPCSLTVCYSMPVPWKIRRFDALSRDSDFFVRCYLK